MNVPNNHLLKADYLGYESTHHQPYVYIMLIIIIISHLSIDYL